MDLYELNYKALDLSEKSAAGMPHDEYLAEIDPLIALMAQDGTPEGEELAYRTRLDAMYARAAHDPVGSIDELKDLYAMHQREPDRFRAHHYASSATTDPAQPLNEDGTPMPNLFRIFLDFIIARIPGREDGTVEKSEEALAFAEEVFDDPDDILNLRIAHHQNRNESDRVVPLLDGYIPGPGDVDKLGAVEWLRRHDIAAMAYLEQGMLEECDEIVDIMVDSGYVSTNQPAAMIAESLSPLASHIDYEKSVRRAQIALQLAVADPHLNEAVIQIATFLLQGGLADEAFALVSATEPFIDDAAGVAGALFVFFRAAAENGHGERAMVRYASPRWQRDLGVGPNPTVAALTDDFGRVALRDAAEGDARNGNDFWARYCNERHRVPTLDADHFEDTAISKLEDDSPRDICFHPVDADYDPELITYAKARIDGSYDGSQYPTRADADPRMSEIRSREPQSMDDITQMFRDMMALAQDPTVDPQLRSTIEINLLLEGLFPEEYLGDVGKHALPFVASFDPDTAIEKTCGLLAQLIELDEEDSGRAHELLDFAVSLAAAEKISYPLLRDLTSGTIQTGRQMDAIAMIDKTLTEQRVHPDVIDDPEAAEVMLRPLKGIRLGRLGSELRGAQEILSAAFLAERTGDITQHVVLIGTALNLLIDAQLASPAENLAGTAEHLLDTTADTAEPWARLEAAAAMARFITRTGDDFFAQEWPATSQRFQSLTEQVLRHDEDAPQLLVKTYDWISDLVELLSSTGRHAESIALTTWAIPVLTEVGNPMVSTLIRGRNAFALGSAGHHDEAALVFENVWERARDIDRSDMMLWVELHLDEFSDRTGAPAYGNLLARLRSEGSGGS